jgi:hypothetical protein
MFDVCTTGDTAHIDTIFRSGSCHTRANIGASMFFTAAVIRAWIIAAVKNIDAPMFTRV